MFSPYTLVNGVQVFLFDSPAATPTPPVGAGMGVAYLGSPRSSWCSAPSARCSAATGG